MSPQEQSMFSRSRTKRTVAGRLRYNLETMPGIAGVTGATAGVGLGYKSLDVDYAVVPYGELGLTNTVSVGFKF